MPIFNNHEFHEEDFSAMIDPFSGRVALILPAPIIQFEDINEYRTWLTYLIDAVPYMIKATRQSDSEEVSIEQNYATAVIDTWQEQIMENLDSPPKKKTTKKSVKKPKHSTSED